MSVITLSTVPLLTNRALLAKIVRFGCVRKYCFCPIFFFSISSAITFFKLMFLSAELSVIVELDPTELLIFVNFANGQNAQK